MLDYVHKKAESQEDEEIQTALDYLHIGNISKIYNYESLLTTCSSSIKHVSFKEGAESDDSSESDRDTQQPGSFNIELFKQLLNLESVTL